MKTIKTIMVPLAFSPHSRYLVRYAVSLAVPLQVDSLLFVNVINKRDVDAVERISSFGYDVDGGSYVDAIEQERTGTLSAMLEGLDYPREQMRLLITVGKPADTLLRIALREQVDMIVMGVRTGGELMHAFTGSVAERLFRRSPVTIVSYRGPDIAAELRRQIRG